MRRILIGLVVAAALAVAPTSALAASDDIFVSEPFAGSPDVGAVIKVDATTHAQSYLTKEGNLPQAQVNQIAFEQSGSVVVAVDTGAVGTVVRVTPAGAQSIVSSGTNLTGTFGIAVGPTGDIFVTDSGKVYKIDPSNGAQSLVPDGDDPLLNTAKGLTVAPNGDIFVVVSTGLVKISGGTASTFSSDAAFQNPQGVARDTGGNLYIANRFGEVTGNILKVGPGGGAPTVYVPTADTKINDPVAITIDRLGNLLVAALKINAQANNPGVVKIDAAKNTSVVSSGGDLLQDARGITVDTTAPPSGGGTPDKTITATLSAKKKQKLKKELVIDVTCPQEACTAAASGSLSVPKVSASKRYKLKKVSKSLKAGEKGKLKLKLSKKVRNKAKRALRKGKKVSAKVTVSATDAAGNVASKTLKIKLKR